MLIMAEVIEDKFREWTKGKNAVEAKVNIYERIRDIPYAAIPEIADSKRYVEILNLGKGSCTPKHLLLGDMYQRLGMQVLYVVYPFRWDNIEDLKIDYPSQLRKLAEELPTSYHLACKVDIDGEFVLVDATLDPALERLGLPVNKEWDGISNTVLPINPCGEEQLYHPSEAGFIQSQTDGESRAFYDELNLWLDKARKH